MLKQTTERIEDELRNQQKVESVPGPTLQNTDVPAFQETQLTQTRVYQPTDDCELETPELSPDPDKQALIADQRSQLSVSVS